jgi:DNA transposition AAA+ family ATPase
VPSDEHLPWLHEFMQKHGLSNATLARKIGMSQTTISQIRHGKYPGDVAGVLKRLEKLRQSLTI